MTRNGLLLGLLGVLTLSVPVRGQEAPTLYQRGLVQEHAAGHLEDAIALYMQAARAAGARLPNDIVEQGMATLQRFPAGMYASMYHDYARGGPIEIEGMSDYIVREGRRLGVPTPHHATIYALLKPHRAGTPRT